MGEVVREDTILETEDLTKEFAGFIAVRGVNLRVRRGHRFAGVSLIQGREMSAVRDRLRQEFEDVAGASD